MNLIYLNVVQCIISRMFNLNVSEVCLKHRSLWIRVRFSACRSLKCLIHWVLYQRLLFVWIGKWHERRRKEARAEIQIGKRWIVIKCWIQIFISIFPTFSLVADCDLTNTKNNNNFYLMVSGHLYVYLLSCNKAICKTNFQPTKCYAEELVFFGYILGQCLH